MTLTQTETAVGIEKRANRYKWYRAEIKNGYKGETMRKQQFKAYVKLLANRGYKKMRKGA